MSTDGLGAFDALIKHEQALGYHSSDSLIPERALIFRVGAKDLPLS